MDGSGEPDTFVNQYTSHLNSLDVLDGGAGKDTLNVETEGAIATVTANISNIETINLKSGSTVTFDTTTYTGVETLNVTKATTSATLDAAATTDVNVSGITTGAVSVDGGKNVNVTVADTGTNTTIGATTGAAGTVTVTDAAQAGSAIAVDGGTDVTITASGNTGGAIGVGQTLANDLPTGAVTVTSTGSYTDSGNTTMGAIAIDGGSTVTVTQSAGITDAQKTAALTAITNDTVTQGAVNVDGGAATTSVTVVQDAAVAALNTIAPGNTANKIGVVAGNVSIDDKNAGIATAATIATVSVTNAGTVAVDSAALATLNLAGTMTTVDTTLSGAATAQNTALALNTTGATTGAITLDAGTKTVNVTNSGTSTVANLTATGATALTVAGSGDLSLTLSALINQAGLTSVNVTNTGSTNFGTTVLNTAATFTAAGGSEKVTIGNSTKAISMGAGNDEVILDSTTTISSITASIDGGAGAADRITFGDMANAVTASADNVFEGKISGFEELELAAGTVTPSSILDLGNLDDISKVIVSANATGAFSIDNMANNGTLRIEASQTSNIGVIVKNAFVPTTDVMNIELSNAIAISGTVTVANVETINVKTEDTDTETAQNVQALSLTATSATSVVVTGNAGANLTGSSFSTDLTSFDASAVTAGAVTYTSDALTKASTVKGGAGNDVINMAAATTAAVVLSGNAGNDTLTGGTVADTINGGEGNDIITGNGGADNLTGGAGYDMFKFIEATHSNGVNADTITDFVSGTDKLGIQSNKAITYAGEVSGYGTALTTLASGTATAVLDTATSTLYVDLNADGALTVADLAIKLNVNDLSQTDFATFGTTGVETITLTAGVDTIYGLGGADTINVVTNTTAIAAVSTDGKSIATTGMDILYVDGSTTVNLTAALGTDASYITVTDIAAGNNISTTVTATTVNQVHGLYDFATGIFTSSATLAADTASTTDVAASMFLYATLDGTTANQGIIIVGSTGNATIAAGVLDFA